MGSMPCAGLGAAIGTMGADSASPRLDGSIFAEGPTFVARSGMEYGSCSTSMHVSSLETQRGLFQREHR